mmetsp:Transcript_6928/g.11036  ORF Transcript_6928/g.11036 Transcript_6928/m.11036 type:complete len:227 (+) Transcript_6928:67-747(+)
MFRRYAVYYTPEPGTPLAVFGASWLGWDSALAEVRPHLNVGPLDLAGITATPRKYGFHGTIKPPFVLAQGRGVDDLADALARICADVAPLDLNGLKLSRLGRFLALVPDGPAPALTGLAARVVQELDGFRAPATEAELAKRRAVRLNPAQDAHLIRWGYPYVLDQFRFHMTLTGRLKKNDLAEVERALEEQVTALNLSPYKMTGLTLLGEDAGGRFHQIHRYALAG